MKKVALVALIALISALSGAGLQQNGAQQYQSGGFTGPAAPSQNSVSAALKAPDDTIVTLTGNIIRQVAHEKYEFTDGVATIIVEIDNDDWYGLTVSPSDTVTIYGEVDSDIFRANEIDVKRITKN